MVKYEKDCEMNKFDQRLSFLTTYHRISFSNHHGTYYGIYTQEMLKNTLNKNLKLNEANEKSGKHSMLSSCCSKLIADGIQNGPNIVNSVNEKICR